MENAVIYARYSSAGQREQSIEGQLMVCRDYAKRMNCTVINEYIDRAKTGTNAHRPQFQRMIEDSAKQQFKYVIVYMVDRFARNTYDSTIYKYELQQNGVRVLSAMEHISDTDEGRLVEGILEIMAEQYSRKLSVRIRDAFQKSLAKGTAWGGRELFGYRRIDNKMVIDENTAPIVKYIFERYAAGVPLKEITDAINAKGYKTRKGKPFTINSFSNTLRNTKYVGKHIVDGIEYLDRYPAIIDEQTFDAVQKNLEKLKHAPATLKAKEEFLLYGKAHCGHCGSNMVGTSGTSHTGATHSYYSCSKRWKKSGSCNKKSESKTKLEVWIVANIKRYILTKTSSERIADLIIKEYDRNINTDAIKETERKIAALNKQLDDIMGLMLNSTTNADIIERLNAKANDLTLQKTEHDKQLAKLRLALALPHSKEDVIDYLKLFAHGNPEDPEYRKRIIDKLVNVIFIYDDKLLVYFNILDDRQITFDMLPDLENAELEPITPTSSGMPKVLISSATAYQKASNENPAYYVVTSGHLGLLVLR